jgi:hypothetical protein
MDPPAGGAAPPPAAAAAAAPGSALAGASREQLAKALERSARKLKAADERATNAEAAAERAVAESERLAKEREALVEKERSSRASAERSAAEASTRASTAETRVAELERSLASERAAVESARAEAETARAALSQASVSATATMEASQETSAALGSTRAALDAKEAELNSARAELESGSRLWDEEKKKVLGALAEIKKKMTKLERRRETLEAEVTAERTKRVETESKLETRLLQVTTELSDAKRSMTAAKDRETEYRARAASVLASKDFQISNLLEEKKNASVEGNANDSLSSVTRNTHGEEDDISRTVSAAVNETETETEKETIRRLRRETIELRAALNDARLLFETTLQKTEETRAALMAENRRAVDAAVTRLTRAVRERDAANVAADEARKLVAQLEAEAFDARKAAKDASKNAERRAARAEKEASEHKARADAARREIHETRERNERAMFAKEALIETLTVENTKLREEVVRKREGQNAVEGSEGEGSLTTRAGVSLNDALSSKKFASSYDDDDDAGFEAFTAYVLGETDHVYGGVRKQNDADTKRSSENAGRGVSAAFQSEQSTDVYAEVYSAPSAGGDAWDLGLSSTLASVSYFFGGALGAGEPSGTPRAVTPTETALGANAAAAADALLKARKTGESRA